MHMIYWIQILWIQILLVPNFVDSIFVFFITWIEMCFITFVKIDECSIYNPISSPTILTTYNQMPKAFDKNPRKKVEPFKLFTL